jgi:hypothetical protein
VDFSYPTGVYTLRINTAHDGNKVQLLTTTNLSTISFPTNPPRVSNFIEAQVVDAFTNFVIKWDAFSGGTSNDFISLSVADANGVVAFRTATFGTEPGLTLLNGTNTSVLISSNKLAPGKTYYGYLIFEKDRVIQTNYVGARGLVGFAKATSFTLQTIPVTPPWLETLPVANNRFVLRLHGDVGKSYVILSTTNFAGGLWTPLVTNVASSGTFYYSNNITTIPNQRFYRAVLKP